MDSSVDPPAPELQLAFLRGQLDSVDAQLLDLVRDRIDICVEIAYVKKRGDIPMMQPGRVRMVHDRAQAYADQHGISRDFVRSLYELIIDETCRVEDLIIDGDPNSSTS